jgi:signal recognition particle GTPase
MQKQKIEDILKSISNDILTEDVKQSIAQMFTEAVEEKVQAQVALIAGTAPELFSFYFLLFTLSIPPVA